MLLYYDTEVIPKVRLIGRIKYATPWIHFPRMIDEYILYVIREGEMFLEENGVRYHLKAGNAIILEPNRPHEGYQKAPCDYYYVHFKHPGFIHVPESEEKDAMTRLVEKRRDSLASYNLDENDVTDSITYLPKLFSLPNQGYRVAFNRAIDIYNQREEHYKRVASAEMHRFFLDVAHENLLMYISHHNSAHVRKSEIVAEELLRYLLSNYTEQISSELIEERFEMNFDYLNRIFTSITGSTIFAYLNAVRINHAKELIATTSLRFNEVAYLVGINNQFYFSKIFRKYTGITPSEYFEHVNNKNRTLMRQ